MEIIHTVNPLHIPETEAIKFPKQEAARAVVFNEDKNKIAMQYATNDKYHKLPGGGLEEGEDIRRALERECEEELGYDVEIDGELGAIVEYRRYENEGVQRVSYCFIARVVNEQRPLNLDAGEIRAGFVVEWMTIDDAISALEKEMKEVLTHRNNQYILPRDLFILKYVQSTIVNLKVG